jgi:hypothetical protein
MNLIPRLFRKRSRIVLHPDPDYRARRLAQFTPERRQRYWRNVGSVGL